MARLTRRGPDLSYSKEHIICVYYEDNLLKCRHLAYQIYPGSHLGNTLLA